MHHEPHPEPAQDAHRTFWLRFGLGLLGFTAIAVFFLWEKHRAHILGALPFLLLAASLLLHLFMHGSHGGHGSAPSDNRPTTADKAPEDNR